MLALVVLCVVGADPGLKPRASADSYPANSSASVLMVGAEMLGPVEVRNTFATDLNKGFYVVEAGVFPAVGKTWDLSPGDFSLRIGSDKIVRASHPATIAAILQGKAQHKGGSPNDIVIYPSATIGYETVGAGSVDHNGRPRRGGWVGGGGAGVGTAGPNNNPPPASTDVDRSTMQTELLDKGLPEGEIKSPVAGYLYFPMPDPKRPANGKKSFELQYQAGETKVRVLLPAPR